MEVVAFYFQQGHPERLRRIDTTDRTDCGASGLVPISCFLTVRVHGGGQTARSARNNL